MIMTEFENWLESGEYKKDTENHKIDVSVEHTNSSYKIEFKNILDFAEICFNKGLNIGFDKGKKSHDCSLVNCDGRENGIKYKQAKRLLKQCDKFLTSDFNDENLEKDLKTTLIRDIHKLLNLSEE